MNYHPGKANVVADALSRKPVSLNVMLESLPSEHKEEIAQLNLVIVEAGLANILTVTPTLRKKSVRPNQAMPICKNTPSIPISRRISMVPSDLGEGFVCLTKRI